MRQTPYLDNNAIFLILTSHYDEKSLQETFKTLDQLSVVNLRVLTEKNGTTLLRKPLNQSKKYIHKILAFDSPPRVKIRNNKIRSRMTHFLDIVSKIENSTMDYQIMPGKNETLIRRELDRFIENGSYQFILNLATTGDLKKPCLSNYEEKGFCSLIPVVKRQRGLMKNEFFIKVRSSFFKKSSFN